MSFDLSVRTWTSAVVALLVASCGGESEPAAHGSTAGDGGVDAGPEITPPAAPQMKSWTCPRGWLPEPMLVSTDLEYSICVPPPLPGSCPDGEMPVLGETECQPIGDPCPALDWPEGLPASSVVYAKAGAMGGDGSSPGSPLGSIAAAVTAAPAGAVVAIAKGTYDEALTVSKTLTLWGACATGVVIEGPPGAGLVDATIKVTIPGNATVRNVTITGARTGILVQGAELEARGVWVRGASGAGIASSAGSVSLDSVSITETNPLADGTLGIGLDVQNGGRATVQSSFLDRNHFLGVYAWSKGTELTLFDVIVRDTQEIAQGAGRGLEVEQEAHVTVERALFERNHELGVAALGAGTSLAITDAAIVDTQSLRADQQGGTGIGLEDGAQATVERVLVRHNRGVGVLVDGVDTTLALTDVVVADTQSQDDKTFGRALSVQFGAHATVDRTLFDRNREVGVIAGGSETDLTMTDVIVRETLSRESDQVGGNGLAVQSRAQARVLRGVFDVNRGMGVTASEEGTYLELTDVLVTGTRSSERDGLLGRGLGAQIGAHAVVQRAAFCGNREVAVSALGAGSDLQLTEVLVEDTLPRDADGTLGAGVAAASGASLALVTSRVAGNRVAGILAMGGSAITVSGTEVAETQSGSFRLLGADGHTEDGPLFEGIGDGVLVVGGSSATLTDVRAMGCTRAGALFSDSTGSLTSVISTANRYGLATQGSPKPSYDATCDFSGNTELPILTDGSLPVPNAPLETPQGP